MRFRLRTLMILLAVMPPLMAVAWVKYRRYFEARNVRVIDASGRRLIVVERCIVELIDDNRVPATEVSILSGPTDNIP